ncbi:hypothetical protein [Altererythrobacter sp. Root672]|uniref:hypothetical protein n=1 Tax=Altererythrobacter sp. Root672 TaxID=1736584 RepID=UPI0006FB6A14|nr:hypothetical protein [Altererythrobacter sp. Root672]KRA79718.1 hypothetical protein ASD76_16980 [Altererythrobacter sp. Root672]
MTCSLEEDTLNLCRELSSRAGMLFEDAGDLTVGVRHHSIDQLRVVVRDALVMNEKAGAILAAAAVLLGDEG